MQLRLSSTAEDRNWAPKDFIRANPFPSTMKCGYTENLSCSFQRWICPPNQYLVAQFIVKPDLVEKVSMAGSDQRRVSVEQKFR